MAEDNTLLRDQAVVEFQEYLKINTSHPNPQYGRALEFMQELATKYDLPHQTVQVADDRGVFVITLKGSNPDLPSVLLNSHCDVVAADPSLWTHDPFGGIKDENGIIYGRGAQDCKCLFIQHLHALRHIKQAGIPLRTIHVTCVPDEEIGGLRGMFLFVQTQFFRDMNVGIAIDEGMASPSYAYSVFNGERTAWFVTASTTGKQGHSSQLYNQPAPANLVKFSNLLLSHPLSISSHSYCSHSHSHSFPHSSSSSPSPSHSLSTSDNISLNELGQHLTVNLTVFQAGITNDGGNYFSFNTMPPTSKAIFDVRIPPTHKREDVKKMLDDCVEESGGQVKYELMNTNYTAANHPIAPATPLDKTNKWWICFEQMIERENIKIVPSIFPAGTDSRFLRNLGFPAIGFSPMNNTPNLFHGNDESLHENVFKTGIDAFIKLMETMANVS